MRLAILALYVLLAGASIYLSHQREAPADPWLIARALPGGHQLLRSDLAPPSTRRSLHRIQPDSFVDKHLTMATVAGDTVSSRQLSELPVPSQTPVGFADLRTLLTAEELGLLRALTTVGDSLTVCSLVSGKVNEPWSCESCGAVVALHGTVSDTAPGWLVLRVHAEHLNRASAVLTGERRLFATRRILRTPTR
jgi:hypothetical protein